MKAKHNLVRSSPTTLFNGDILILILLRVTFKSFSLDLRRSAPFLMLVVIQKNPKRGFHAVFLVSVFVEPFRNL